MTRVGIVGYQISPLCIGIYLFILVVLVYNHTLNADWHLDDDNDILQNRNNTIGSLDPDSLGKAVYVPFLGDPRSSRPLPMLFFALNRYEQGANPLGCHMANNTHFMTTLLTLPDNCGLAAENAPVAIRIQRAGQTIALLAAICWAVNPVQAQAVTYIVQRMATMAAIFDLLSLYLYIQGRIRPNHWRRYSWWLGSAIV